jgi:gliding motility-associated-like protein
MGMECDYWKLKVLTPCLIQNLYIFDRYGKLLNQLNPAGPGWDGTFNNQPLPSDDYWFTIKLEDEKQKRTFCFKTII